MASIVVSNQTSVQQAAQSTANPCASEAILELSAIVASGAIPLPGSGLVIGVDVTAVGTNTLAGLEMEASVGPASTSASVSMVAMSDGGAGSATGFATIDFIGDAKPAMFFSAVGQNQQTSFQTPDLFVTTASSSFTVAAVFAPWPEAPDPQTPFALPGDPLPPPAELLPPAVFSTLDDGGFLGNVAVFFVEASAFGDDSFVDLQLATFTLEDQLSTVNAMVTLLVA